MCLRKLASLYVLQLFKSFIIITAYKYTSDSLAEAGCVFFICSDEDIVYDLKCLTELC